MIRLGLADDEPLHIMGLATLLGAQPDMEIIWRAADGKEALARNAADPADVLLLDVQMPGLSGPATSGFLSLGVLQKSTPTSFCICASGLRVPFAWFLAAIMASSSLRSPWRWK